MSGDVLLPGVVLGPWRARAGTSLLTSGAMGLLRGLDSLYLEFPSGKT